jgi:2-furoyl-CoA dehydrogenase large subunit
MDIPGRKWVGQPVRRLEDRRLTTGKGSFVDDLPIGPVHHVAILRSPHAHAEIRAIRTAKARAAPGVIAVLTGEEVERRSRPFGLVLKEPIRYYSAAVGRARFVGEPVAAVVAESRYLAEDAAELIEVDYKPLEPVVDAERALAVDAPLLHPLVGSNVANHRLLSYGDVDAAFRAADLVIQERFRFHKYASTPLEGYAVIAAYNEATEILTIWANFQGPFIMHSVIAMALGIPDNRLRVIVPPDIGGAFGIKTSIYPYMTLVALAAMVSGKTVKWIEDRREHLLASSSGADRVSYVEAPVKRDGTILALRYRVIDNVGAYLRTPEPACLYVRLSTFTGPYRVPALEIDGYVVMTNVSPTGPNRGYGGQQLAFTLERLVDEIGTQLGLDPTEVRLRNLIQPQDFPYSTPSGGRYDSGDYPGVLRKALDMADYEGLREEQRRARAEGRLVGMGLAAVMDATVTNISYIQVANPPQERAKEDYRAKSGSGETAVVGMDPLGSVTAVINSVAQGQGHETTVAQVVADELGLTPEQINVVGGMDTFERLWSITTGTYSSRFSSTAVSAMAVASRRLREKIVAIASHVFKVAPAAVRLADGSVIIAGDPEQRHPLRHIAGMAHWNQTLLPPGMEPGLRVTHMFNLPTSLPPDEHDRVNSQNIYGFGVDVVVVEVDPETGQVTILKYVTVHDSGTILNPLLVEGQLYGGVAHGIGGALYEHLAYDEDGQMLAATFMDYCVPTASQVPRRLEIGHLHTPSPLTVLGSKGCAEATSMSAPAALANAVADALRPLGVEVRELPLTPARIWTWLQAARGVGTGAR